MTRLTAGLMLLVMVAAPAVAQRPDSGTVRVTVDESMGMSSGFRVQSAGKTALTDQEGVARLILSSGRHDIVITRIGFKPAAVTVTVVRDSVVSVLVPVDMAAMEMSDVRISATRTEKLAGETPIRVEVVDKMEVDEKTLMSPSGIGMLLNETPGLRVQAAAPGLGTGSVRILGLPGQYTVLLADGLPLYGGASSAIGPLDISPVDLQRMEVIKGAASALYGGQSLGGVINLVSKPPTGQKEILFNRRTLGVTDAAIRGSATIGGTPVSLCVMDFAFMGGSMGSVVGEKVTLAAEHALEARIPLLIVSASGGARMQEGTLALMQLAKTCAALARLADAGVPFVSLLTDPTTGGVFASFAALGDVNIAEPGALIGFAGARVAAGTTGETLPEGFQRAEFLHAHGFVDLVVPRAALRDTIAGLLRYLRPRPVRRALVTEVADA